MISPRQARKYRAWSVALVLWFPTSLLVPAVIQKLNLVQFSYFIVLAGVALLSGFVALLAGGLLARHVVRQASEGGNGKLELTYTGLLLGALRFPLVVFSATKPYLSRPGEAR